MKISIILLSVILLCSCSNQPQQVSDSAKQFIASLSAAEKKTALLEYNSKLRHNWHFFPLKTRKGLMIKNMSKEQRALALNVVADATSKIGFERTLIIMDFEQILHNLENNNPTRDPEKYYLTLFGTPGQGKWGISYEGHHLSLNFVIEGEELVSATPLFLGVNPATVIDNGGTKYNKGFRLLADQEDTGFSLFQALTAKQQKSALVSKGNPKGIEGYNASPGPRQKIGVAVKSFTAEQKKILTRLLHTFTENAEKGFAAESNYGFEKEMDDLYFAWYGNTTDKTKPHSFRIEGPETYIIFQNFQTDSLKKKANHIHSLWRNRIKDFAYNLKNH